MTRIFSQLEDVMVLRLGLICIEEKKKNNAEMTT